MLNTESQASFDTQRWSDARPDLRVLVVDDHRLTLDGLREIVASIPRVASVDIANCAKDATQLLAQQQGGYELILIDPYLQSADGLIFLQALKDREDCIPTLLVSATTDRDLITQAVKQGARGFISKKSTPSELKAGIAKVLDGELAIPSELVAEFGEPKSDKSCPDKNPKQTGITLKKRQSQVLTLIAQGHTNKSIAHELCISQATVKSHIYNLFKLLDVPNRTACTIKSYKLGLIGAG